MDPEDLREVISAYQKCVADTVRHYDGFVAKYMGDGVLVYFGYPQAHEDDAERAVRAGLEIVAAITALKSNVLLQTRVGIATGLVVVGDLIGSGASQEQAIVGETPNLAARLQGIAEPNVVVIAEGTRKLLGNLFELEDLGAKDLKGIAGPARGWAVLRPASIEGRFDAFHATGLTELVGREEELEILLRRWSKAKSGEGQVVLLSGEPGIGKSRLTAALLERLAAEPHTRLRNFCSPQHTDSALYPIIGQIERAAGFRHNDAPQAKLDKLDALLAQSSTSPNDAALLAEMLSLPNDGRYPGLELTSPERREKTLETLVSQVTTVARQNPLLMIFEDAHWADPTSLELFGRIADKIPNLRVLLIVTYRPEFNPPWIGRPYVAALTLNRLGGREVDAMIDRVAGNKHLSVDLRQDIIGRTDGIPLFVEEMTKAVLEADSQSAAERTAAAIPSSALAVPATLHASLMARLDRLGPAKEIAQIGSAIGREFSHALLAAVVSKPEAELGLALDRLIAAGLLSRQGLPPHASYLFKHALVQDAAYGTLLRGRRQELHARIGKVFEQQFPDSVGIQPEILAHHYTEAGLAEIAIGYWQNAGEYALRRSANAEAAAHLSKAIALVATLPASAARNREELSLQMALGSAIRANTGHASAETLHVYTRARELLDDSVPLKEQMAVLYGLWAVDVTRANNERALEVGQQSLAIAARHDDSEASAFANRMTGVSRLVMGDFAVAAEHLERVVTLFEPGAPNVTDLRYSQDHAVFSLTMLALTLFPRGYPQQAAIASAKSLSWAHRIEHAMSVGFALSFGSVLNGFVGADVLEGGQHSVRALAYCVEHDLKAYIPWSRFYHGLALARRGEIRQGIDLMNDGIAGAERISMNMLQPAHLGHLALIHASAGDQEAGLRLLDQAVRMAKETEERVFEAELYRLRGEILIQSQRTAEAETAFYSALAQARQRQAMMWELRSAMSMARLWRDQGKRQQAHDLLAPVYGWFTEGFDTLDLKEAKALLEQLKA